MTSLVVRKRCCSPWLAAFIVLCISWFSCWPGSTTLNNTMSNTWGIYIIFSFTSAFCSFTVPASPCIYTAHFSSLLLSHLSEREGGEREQLQKVKNHHFWLKSRHEKRRSINKTLIVNLYIRCHYSKWHIFSDEKQNQQTSQNFCRMKMKVCKHVRKRTTGNFHSSMKMDADIRVHANPAKKKTLLQQGG